MGLVSHMLGKVMDWALDKNGRGSYGGGDDSRWAYTIRSPDGSDYLSRLLLPRVRIPFTSFSFRPMLHQFHRPDDDREMHNHPWAWSASVILAGSYDEVRLAGDPRPDRYMTAEGWCQMCGGWRGACAGHEPDVDEKHVRFFNVIRGDDYHRVSRLRGDVWTLFIGGTKKPDDAWGFLSASGTHIDHETFLAARREAYEAVKRYPGGYE